MLSIFILKNLNFLLTRSDGRWYSDGERFGGYLDASASVHLPAALPCSRELCDTTQSGAIPVFVAEESCSQN